MLPAGHRLRASADFSAALRGGSGASGGPVRCGSTLLVVHAHSTDARAGLPPRVGFAVSKAVGGAVVRNRTKRRLRALMAARLDRLPPGTDLVVRANPLAAQANSSHLGADLDVLVAKAVGRLGQRTAGRQR